MTRIKTLLLAFYCIFISCRNNEKNDPVTKTPKADTILAKKEPRPISQPLVTSIYTADPSAHVFNGKIYIYPSHDFEFGVKEDDLGSHFDMKDYHILSMDSVGGPVADHGLALDIKDVA